MPVLRQKLHDYNVKMLSGDSEFDRVYSNFSSDATEPKHCNFSIVDLTARHTTIHEGEVGFFKSCIDLRELPKNPENDKKTDHTPKKELF